nr:MAG TPA: intron associated endonuclease [Caudoviricetes sp.]
MELKYIVYLTINLCNGKFYIGVHKTNPNVFDGYIGCGVYRQSNASKKQAFHSAVRKYGYDKFKRTTLRIFPDTEEGKKAAYNLEKELVTSTVLKSKNCYNECVESLDSISPKYMTSTAKELNNDRLKPVAQYTLSGKFIRHFESMSEACTLLQCNTIYQAIINHYQAVGYQWRYFSGDCSDIEPLLKNKTVYQKSPIIMYDKKGIKIAEYKDSKDCVNHNPNLRTNSINKVLKGVLRSHKRFVFKYKDEDIV